MKPHCKTHFVAAILLCNCAKNHGNRFRINKVRVLLHFFNATTWELARYGDEGSISLPVCMVNLSIFITPTVVVGGRRSFHIKFCPKCHAPSINPLLPLCLSRIIICAFGITGMLLASTYSYTDEKCTFCWKPHYYITPGSRDFGPERWYQTSSDKLLDLCDTVPTRTKCTCKIWSISIMFCYKKLHLSN